MSEADVVLSHDLFLVFLFEWLCLYLNGTVDRQVCLQNTYNLQAFCFMKYITYFTKLDWYVSPP